MDDLDQDYFMLLSNITESDYFDETHENEEEAILTQGKYLISFGIFLIVTSLVGNTFVLFHIVLNPRLRKKHLLLLNLSLADILATLAVHLFMVISIWNDFSWLAGNVFCKIFIFVQVSMEAGSVYAILAIIVDEFLVLVRPSGTRLPSRMSILGSWLLALIPALPHLYIAGEIPMMERHNTCISIGNLNHEIPTYLIYLTLIFTLYFYLPIVCGIIMYALIFLKAKPWSLHVVSPKAFTMFILSLTLFGMALFTSVPFVIEHNVFSFSHFTLSTIELDSWLYFVLLSRNAINPYIYVAFYFRQIFHKRTLERTDAVPLVVPFAENTVSCSTQVAKEAPTK